MGGLGSANIEDYTLFMGGPFLGVSAGLLMAVDTNTIPYEPAGSQKQGIWLRRGANRSGSGSRPSLVSSESLRRDKAL